MKRAVILLTTAVVCIMLAGAWPDGAPCIHAVIESMNPLEAVEHQGGLELSTPPFYIHTDVKCYWRHQPIELILRGNSTRDKFKGFAIQPIVYDGPRQGQRLGQFLRLDDNGSWQQQCFQRKDSVTHSHDESKARLGLWWQNDADDNDVVQFVATVVVSLRKFWVKSVLSTPLPPCRLRSELTDWKRPTSISIPPPVSSFKLDTFRMFNKEQSALLAQSISSLPDFSKQLPQSQRFAFPHQFQSSPTSRSDLLATQTFTPHRLSRQDRVIVQTSTFASPVVTTAARRHLGHVIPISSMLTNRRPNRLLPQQQQTLSQTVNQIMNADNSKQAQQQFGFRQDEQHFQQQNALQRFQQQMQQQRIRQQQQTQHQQQQFRANASCRDIDSSQHCSDWRGFCPRSEYMRSFCQRTCQFC